MLVDELLKDDTLTNEVKDEKSQDELMEELFSRKEQQEEKMETILMYDPQGHIQIWGRKNNDIKLLKTCTITLVDLLNSEEVTK